MQRAKTFSIIGLLAAIASSLCCIAPALALIGGITGAAGAFAWIEPLRPYLLGMAVISLSIAWYLHLTKKDNCKGDSCSCAESARRQPSWMHSRAFLIAITAFALTAGTYPYMLGWINKTHHSAVQTAPTSDDVETLVLDIDGMTCTGCEYHIEHALQKLNGVFSADASYEKGTALVSFDPNLLPIDTIIHTVNQTGYTVKDYHRSNTSENLH